MNEWKQRLKQAREAKDLNKTTFAKLVGVSNATATDWEKSVDAGGINEISGAKLTRIGEVLGVDPRWLLHGRAEHEGEGGSGASTAARPVQQVFDAAAAEELLRRAAELMETYSLADAADRKRIDLVVRDIRRKIDATDKAKPGTS